MAVTPFAPTDPTPAAVLERLRRAAATARDLLAHAGVARWEVFAKSSLTRELEVGDRRPLAAVHTEETGVAVRTFASAATGFASASGLEAGAARTAVGSAVALASPVPFDPLPPDRLLASSPVGEAPPLPPPGWAQHAAAELAGALRATSRGRLRVLRSVVQEGSFAWLLTTGGGFVATFAGTSTALLAELLVGAEGSALWREWVHVGDARDLDVVALAEQLANRALLTCTPLTSDTGSRDVILHGEVVAHVLSALAPLFLALPERADPMPGLLDREGRLASPSLTLLDDRTSPGAPVTGPCDGEGLPARRTLLLDDGVPRHRLASYRDALLSGESPRGGAVRLSYRDYPSSGIANLQVDASQGLPPGQLLASTQRALYLLRPLAPVEVDLARGAYRLVASGVWLGRGHIRGWQPVVELRGDLGTLLRRVEGVGTDLAWYQTDSGCVAAPTLLARRQPVC